MMRNGFNKNKDFLLGLDLDETLVYSYDEINKENVKWILYLHKKYKAKFKLAFISGRNLFDMKSIWNKYFYFINEQNYVAINGAHIVYIKNKKEEILFKKHLIINNSLINCLLSINSLSFSTLFTNFLINEHSMFLKKSILSKYINSSEIYKITGYMPIGFENAKFYKELMRLKNRQEISFYIHEEYNNYIEITTGGVEKTFGLKTFANNFNIDRNNIIAIGNGPNDYSMLNNVLNSFLVRNHSLTKTPMHTIILKESCYEGFLKEVLQKLNLF